MNSQTVTQLIPMERVENLICLVRGEKVLLDSDLAMLYGVETKALNRAVKRNRSRFPQDFTFQLTPEEADNLRCQSGTSSSGYGGRRYRPYLKATTRPSNPSSMPSANSRPHPWQNLPGKWASTSRTPPNPTA